MDNNQISISPLTTVLVLGTAALMLVLISVAGQLFKFKFGYDVEWFLPLFDLSLELNLPNFFSMSLMFIASSLLFLVSIIQGKRKEPDISKWVLLSIGFLCMAYDEGFQVHEDLVEVFRPMLDGGRQGIFYYAWVIPALVLVSVLGLFFIGFLVRLPSRTRLLFLSSASIYLSGSIGFELIGGYYDELYGMDNLTYNLISSLEESLELSGLLLFIYALLDYIETNFPDVHFHVTSKIP